MKISSKPASGMRDFLAGDVRRRRWVIERISRAYESFGFEPLETPAIERIDVLTGKYGDEGDQLMFKLLVRGDKLSAIDPNDPSTMTDLALHYDLTVPLARVYAQHQNDLPKFYKRYQIQPVWRADRPQRGRFREFFQCDVDYVGTESSVAELEVLGAMLQALRSLRFGAMTVRLNDRRILSALMDVAEVEEGSREATLTTLDKLDKIGAEAVAKALSDEVGLSDTSISRLESVVLSADADTDAISCLRDALSDHESGAAALAGLEALREDVRALSGESQEVRIDPTLVRGMSYYTGTIFEFVSPDFSGSIAGGGRYDGLVGMFSGRDVPAVGGSLGLERILVLMEERDLFPKLPDAIDVFFVQLDEEAHGDVVSTASRLRDAGFSVAIHPELTKLGKQFKYAESIGARYVAILGKREVEAGTVEVKDLTTGTQESVPADKLTGFVKRLPDTTNDD